MSIDIYLFGLRKEKSQDGTIGQIENIYISELETEVVAIRHVRSNVWSRSLNKHHPEITCRHLTNYCSIKEPDIGSSHVFNIKNKEKIEEFF